MSTLRVSNLQNASAASPAIVLDANSRATLNGLSYPTEGSLSGRNRIINGDMRIDQRNAGASVTPTTLAYTVDRWAAAEQTDGSMTVQQSTTAPSGFTNSLLTTVTSADTSLGATQYAVLRHAVEGYNVADLAWGTASAQAITLSFKVRSSLTGTFGGAIQNSAQDRSYPFTFTINSANTFEDKTITIPGDTSGTWLTNNGVGLAIWFGLGVGSTYSGTAGSWSGSLLFSATGATSVVGTNGATFYITGVQLEAGSVATPFERRSYGQELSLCQRYYEVGEASGGQSTWSGRVTTSTYARQSVSYKVAKRATPGTVTATTADFGAFSSAAPTINNSSLHGFSWYKLATSTSDDGYAAINWNSSAEL